MWTLLLTVRMPLLINFYQQFLRHYAILPTITKFSVDGLPSFLYFSRQLIAPNSTGSYFDKRGDAFRGIPKLRILVVLEFYLGCLGHPQAYALSTPYSKNPSNLYPKLENFTTQNSTENLMSSGSIRKQTTT